MAINPQAPLGYDSLGLPVLDDETAIKNLVHRLREETIRRSFIETLGKPNVNRVKDMLKEDRRDLPPERQNMLRDPVQVAALPNQVVDVLARVNQLSPEERALETAKSFLSSVPLEQAREMERALKEQQLERELEMARGQAFGRLTSAPPPAPIDYAELDQMIADQLAAERAAMEEASQSAMEAGRESALAPPDPAFDYSELDAMIADQIAAERAAMEEQDQIAAMNELASAFGIGMETTQDMGRAEYAAAHDPLGVEDFAPFAEEMGDEPGPMSTPFGVAMGEIGTNLTANPMSGQYGPMAQHQMAAYAEDDPFGEDPFSNAAPAFSIAPASVTPDLAAAMAAISREADDVARASLAQQEDDAYSAFEGRRADAFSNLSPALAPSMVASFAAPAMQGSLPGIGQEDVELGQAVAPDMGRVAIADQIALDQILGPVPDVFTANEEAEAERDAYAALEAARGRAFGNLAPPASMPSFVSPAVAEQMAAQARAEAEAYAEMEAARGAAFGNLTSPATVSPALASAMEAISREADDVARANLSAVPAEDEEPAAPPAPPAMVSLEPDFDAPFTQLTGPLSPEEEAEIAEAMAAQEQAVSPFGSAPVGTAFGRANPALEQAFLENLSYLSQIDENVREPYEPATWAQNPVAVAVRSGQLADTAFGNNPFSRAGFGQRLGSPASMDAEPGTRQISSLMAADEDFGAPPSPPALSPSLAAQSLAVSSLAADPFGAFSDAALGFTGPGISTADITGAMGGLSDDDTADEAGATSITGGFDSDPASGLGAALSAALSDLGSSFGGTAEGSPAGDGTGTMSGGIGGDTDSDSDDGGPSGVGLSGIGLGPSDTDISGIGADTSTDGSPAGDGGGVAGGADVSGGGGGTSSSGAPGSLGDAFGSDPFGDPSDPSTWWKGGRVNGSSLDPAMSTTAAVSRPKQRRGTSSRSRPGRSI